MSKATKRIAMTLRILDNDGHESAGVAFDSSIEDVIIGGVLTAKELSLSAGMIDSIKMHLAVEKMMDAVKATKTGAKP